MTSHMLEKTVQNMMDKKVISSNGQCSREATTRLYIIYLLLGLKEKILQLCQETLQIAFLTFRIEAWIY